MSKLFGSKISSLLRSHSFRRRRRASQRSSRTSLFLEHLEDRLLLATLFDGGTAVLSIDLALNENLAVVSNGTTYTFTTDQTFSATNGTDPANQGGPTPAFSAFGETSLTLTAAGLAQYTDISITDSGANTTVTFDVGANAYSDNFSVILDDVAAGAVTFNGATSFTGTAALTARTTGAVTISSGATITQAAGTLSLTADGSLTAPKVDNDIADITAPTIALAGATIGASAADRVEVNGTNLDVNGSSDVFITDTAGGVAVGLVTAGLGDVTLT